MSKITISKLQTAENLLVDLQTIDAHNVMGGKKYCGDGHGHGGGYEGGGHGGGGYCPPVYCPPCH
jgi:uncharacterized membrane protein